MLFAIFISLLIKSIKADKIRKMVQITALPVDITITITQDTEVVFQESIKAYDTTKYIPIEIEPIDNLVVTGKNRYCEDEEITYTLTELGYLNIGSQDIPTTCYPSTVIVNIAEDIPSVYKLGYKINDGLIQPVSGTRVVAEGVPSTTKVYIYLLESGCEENHLVATYNAKAASYLTYQFQFSNIDESCYLYELQVSLVSLPNYYTLFYKIGDAEEHKITEDNLHLTDLEKDTQVQIFVQSSPCQELEIVNTFPAKAISPDSVPDEITEASIPSKCVPDFYLSFDLSELEGMRDNAKIYYSEDGEEITINDKSLINKKGSFSITPKFTSQSSGCSEYELQEFEAKQENEPHTIKITTEMLKKLGASESCIFPQRYLKLSEDFQNEYITICRKLRNGYGDNYYCEDSGEEYSEEYYGSPKTYEIYYKSGYCTSKSLEDNVRFIGNATSNEDITKATYKYGQDIIESECKKSYKILLDYKNYENEDVKYTLPDGVIETKPSDGYILFTGETNFSIKFTQARSDCTNVLEATVYPKPPESHSYGIYAYYEYPPKQNLNFDYCMPDSEGTIIVGTLVGVIIGFVALAAVIVIIIVVIIRYVRKRRQKARNQESTTLESNLLKANA